jgi:hypothetical protein
MPNLACLSAMPALKHSQEERKEEEEYSTTTRFKHTHLFTARDGDDAHHQQS